MYRIKDCFCCLSRFYKRKAEIYQWRKHKKRKEIEILRLIYEDRMRHKQRFLEEETWMQKAMTILTKGVFECRRNGSYMEQTRACEWSVVFEMLQWLPHAITTVRLEVCKDDFKNIEHRYKVIEKAVKQGWIQMDVHRLNENSAELSTNLSCDTGDSDGYGRDSTELYIELDCKGYGMVG